MMGLFFTPLIEEQIGESVWRLTEPLIYRSSIDAAGSITVPAGFVTDHASVARLPIVYWLFGNIGNQAAVIHDFLYRYHGQQKETADAVFREALLTLGLGWKAWAMWAAVRFSSAGDAAYWNGAYMGLWGQPPTEANLRVFDIHSPEIHRALQQKR